MSLIPVSSVVKCNHYLLPLDFCGDLVKQRVQPLMEFLQHGRTSLPARWQKVLQVLCAWGRAVGLWACSHAEVLKATREGSLSALLVESQALVLPQLSPNFGLARAGDFLFSSLSWKPQVNLARTISLGMTYIHSASHIALTPLPPPSLTHFLPCSPEVPLPCPHRTKAYSLASCRSPLQLSPPARGHP